MRFGRSRFVSRLERQCEYGCARWILRILLVVFFIVAPYLSYVAERERREMGLAFSEVESKIVEVDATLPPTASVTVGQLIHARNVGPVLPEATLGDADFGVAHPYALRLRRVVEYCQWAEFFTDHTTRDSDGRETTVRSYYYVKGWHSHRIPSLLFDQPFHHHNPLRDPFPETAWETPKAKLGSQFTAGTALLHKMTSFSTVLFGAADAGVSLNRASFEASPAAAAHHFRYLGGGYFYSPDQESTMTLLGRLAGMWLEGSLDFQLGDLFASCTAGDIRVHYEAVAPQRVSFVAQLSDASGTLTEFVTSRNYRVGYVHAGDKSWNDIFEAETNSQWWRVFGTRMLAVLWALAVVLCFTDVRGWQDVLTGTTILTMLHLGAAWLLVWGTSIIALFMFLVPVLFFVSRLVSVVGPTPSWSSSTTTPTTATSSAQSHTQPTTTTYPRHHPVDHKNN